MAAPANSVTDVLVLGAGLAGLSAHLHLRRAGVTLRHVERLATAGGHAITIEEEGFRFDRTGHLLHLRDAGMRALVLGLLGADHLVVERRSRVYSHGVYTRYPFQANTFGLPPAVAYECVMGFLEAHFASDRPAPATFEDFITLHFGRGIARHFMIPYNERLWGVHPREMTTAWCDRFVPRPSLEDVIAGAVGRNDRELGYNAQFVYPRLGIGALSEALAAACGPIELSRAPTAIDWRARRASFEGETIVYERLLSTVPLDVLGRLLSDMPGEVADAFAKLRCTELYYLDVALDAPLARDLHWVYVPEPQFPFYRVGCYSHFSPAMAPPGKAGLYVELADRRPPAMTTLVPEITAHLVAMGLVARPGDVRFMRLRHIEHAYVVYDRDRESALATIMPFLERAGITTTGRYGGWNYSSMEDALLFGRDAAARLAGATA